MRLIQALTILKDEFLLLPMPSNANGFVSSSLSLKKTLLFRRGVTFVLQLTVTLFRLISQLIAKTLVSHQTENE